VIVVEAKFNHLMGIIRAKARNVIMISACHAVKVEVKDIRTLQLI
jgi:hypothetical protein